MGNPTRSNADRQRIRQAAEERRKAKENKVFYALVIATAIIVAAIFLGGALKDALTLPAEIRNVDAIQDNWIVIDTANKVTKRYHHPASFDIPEGYVRAELLEEEGTTTPKTNYLQNFLCKATDPAAPVMSLYVDAGYNLNAADYIQRVSNYSTSALNEGSSLISVGTPFTATIAGYEAHCLYLSYSTAEGDYGTLICAFNAPRNVCVYATLGGSYTTPDAVQTQEQLLEEAQTLLAGLTIID